MLMTEPTPEMIDEWKEISEEYKGRLTPNRKGGQEIVDYLTSKYSLKDVYDHMMINALAGIVNCTEPYAEKLPDGRNPEPRIFQVENDGEGAVLFEKQDDVYKGTPILVGVDLASGFYSVEGSSMLWDELCAFQGLDEIDIDNYYCVAQYITCLKRFGLLEEALSV